GYVLSGMASTQTSGWDMYVMQTNSFGDSVWSRRFGGSSDDRGWAIETLNDGSIVAAGWVHSFGAGGGDVYLLKLSMKNITGINPGVNPIQSFELSQNYPNPFNPSTKIRFWIKNSDFVSLKVYNTLGQLVKTLVDDYRSPGNYEVEFEGNDLPGGAYFYQLKTGEFTETRIMMLTK
ncbi:MAG: T9SS type A sorting domain-containing protein, partial [Ignavibacteria bacterium]